MNHLITLSTVMMMRSAEAAGLGYPVLGRE